MPPFRSMFKLFSIVNKFPKMEKLFTILNSFLIFGKLFSKSGQGCKRPAFGHRPYKYAAKAATFSVEPVELGIYIPFTI